MNSEAAIHPQPRRRWLQFSLRTMLVLVFGARLGWFAYRVHRARMPRQAGEAIEKMGGRVTYERASSGRGRTLVAWLGRFWGEDLARDVAVHR